MALDPALEHALLGEEDDFVVIFVDEGHLHRLHFYHIEDSVHFSHLSDLLADLLLCLLRTADELAGLGPTVQIVFDVLASLGLDTAKGILIVSLGLNVMARAGTVIPILGLS